MALGYIRHGLLPHPLQVAEGERVRQRIIKALMEATDVVFSHFHGDHIPLREANPYQVAIRDLPENFPNICCWSKSLNALTEKMKLRAEDLQELLGANFHVGEGCTDGPISFSGKIPHGEARGNRRGSVMMTRIDLGDKVFVHASDVQLTDAATIDCIIAWRPDIVLAAGPPLYIHMFPEELRTAAWENGLRLAGNVDVLILDHHLMRDRQGPAWLQALSAEGGQTSLLCRGFYGQKTSSSGG